MAGSFLKGGAVMVSCGRHCGSGVGLAVHCVQAVKGRRGSRALAADRRQHLGRLLGSLQDAV